MRNATDRTLTRALSHTKHQEAYMHYREKCPIINTQLSGLRKKRGNAVYQITRDNFNQQYFGNFNFLKKNDLFHILHII